MSLWLIVRFFLKTQQDGAEPDYFFPDGFTSLGADPRKEVRTVPKSPFEGGSTILLGGDEEEEPSAQVWPPRPSAPPPPPVSRRGSIGGNPAGPGSSPSSSSSGRKGPKRFSPPWQQDGASGGSRRSRGSGGTVEPPSVRFGGSFQPAQPRGSNGGRRQQQSQQGQPQGNANGTPPPTRVYRPPGSFDLEDARGPGGGGGGMSARQREDMQVANLLGVFSNANVQLVGGISLAALAVAFGFAWKSGFLENTSPSSAMLRDPDAAEYMLRSEFPRDVDVTVKIEDKIVTGQGEEEEVDVL